MKNKWICASVLVGALAVAGGAFAQGMPANNVSHKRHPNLSAAQALCTKAFEKISAAQQANEFDMDGHAEKAKELLDQANNELRQSATDANRH